MKTRLNITIDDKLLPYVKQYAATHNLSVSELVETYFRKLGNPGKENIIDVVEGLKKPEIPAKADLKDLYYQQHG
ncbi:MAG: hypothetical protein H0X33_04125 [Taibaiella sp.]|nr:hypothetical protein [Taibaiella sp.]